MATPLEQALVSKIVGLLKDRTSLTTSEIAQKIGVNWETAKNNLLKLKQAGLVESKEDGKILWWLTQPNVAILENNDTVLGIQLSPTEQKWTESLFAIIRERWPKELLPNKTQVQKTAVELANRLTLPVPRGWYLWGELCLLSCDLNKSYAQKENFSDQQIKIIDEVIAEFSPEPAFKLAERQIDKAPMQYKLMYLKKNEILRMLSRGNINKTVLIDNLCTFAMCVNQNNKEVADLVNAFISIASALLKNNTDLLKIYPEINDTFVDVWHLVATYNFFDSLIENKISLDRDVLRSFFKIPMANARAILKEHLEILRDEIKLDYVPIDHPLRKYKGVGKLN